MKELIKAVEYNIKPILWYLVTIIVCLLIGTAIGTFWFHDVLSPPMQVTDTTQAEYHGVTIHPATVAAAAGVLAGMIARIQLTMNFPAVHEQAIERVRDERGSSDSTGSIRNSGISGMDLGDNQSNIKVFDFTSRGGGWFDTDGVIVFKAWEIPLVISQLASGDYQVLTNEDGVSFTVKSAVAVKPKPVLKWSAGYLYGTDGSHEIIISRDLTGWLAAQGAVEKRGQGYAVKAGGEVRW